MAAVALVAVAACGSSKSSATATASPSPVASIPTLTGVSTSVALDPSFLAALTSLGVKPGVYGTATLSGTTVSFPITGGNVEYYKPGSVTPYVTGSIDHQGSGLTLTAGSTTVTLSNFVVNPGTSELTGDVAVNGKTAATGADLFFLNGSTLQPLDTTTDPGDAILAGTHVEVSATAASLLDTTFKTTGVKADLLVGVATIKVAVPAS